MNIHTIETDVENSTDKPKVGNENNVPKSLQLTPASLASILIDKILI